MREGRIYVLGREGGLSPMVESAYAAEELLQRLLAEHPDLLAGEQLNPSEPLRWMLVSREMGVPDREDGSGRWSLDHLFIDQHGVPTLVEVKRATDTRARREVVAQMLDYAANAVVHWPIEQVRAKFDETCRGAGLDPEAVVAELIEAGDLEVFWQSVKTNLQAGRIRMLFVADKIHPELERIVEFLNSQMDPAEVMAVEVRQFTGDAGQVLVPRVMGRTAEATVRKSASRATRQWDATSFLDDLRSRRGMEVMGIAEWILDWARNRGVPIEFGRGTQTGTASLKVMVDGKRHHAFNMLSSGLIQVGFSTIAASPPFEREGQRLELLEQFNRVPGVDLTPDSIDGWPTFSMAPLATEDARRLLVEAYDWYATKLTIASG